ncbi:MAG: STN and carboxypeptidase regulatory-like domain-containing protein [Bacteroidota bacterium]
MKVKPAILVLFFTLLFGGLLRAQSNYVALLDRKVSLNYTNEKVITVLNRIGQQAGLTFSYNASIIPADQVVSISLNNKTVREALNEIFKGSMNYKEKGNHVILTRVAVKQTKPTVTAMIISGYVEDSETKERIVNASVYEKESITSVVTDEFGFFRIRLEKKEEGVLRLSISKKNYRDTTVLLADSGNQYFHVSLRNMQPKRDTMVVADPAPPDTTQTPEQELEVEQQEEELVLPYLTAPNVQNISDTLYRTFQFSFLPFMGTNGQLSGNVINDYSINLLGGYSLGTRQVEVGGFFNFDRGDAAWAQIAGFGNMVGGRVQGIQVAGFFNANGGASTAVQVAGFGNMNFREFQGVQVAGFTNISLKEADGVQVAGFANYSKGYSRGVQVAGFANVHRQSLDGSQVAGFTNVATGSLRGSQVAGFANIASGTVRGSQVAAFFNYGGKVRGSQVAFLNVADSLTGVPVGFLSFVSHGYHKIELSADEVFFGNLAFRSGVRQFYNIIHASFKPDYAFGRDNVWSFGYGVGTARRVAPWLHLNLDITSQHVNKASFINATSLLNKVHVGFDFLLLKKLSLYTGVTVNGYVTETDYTDYPELFTDFTPRIFHEDTYHGRVNLKMWLGGKVALRFL